MSGIYGNAPPSVSATPVWDVRRLPSSQGPPPFGIAIPQQPPQAAGNGVSEELANKVAEVDVLRKRLQQFERENSKIKTELSVAKDQGAQQEKNRQMQGEVDRLNNELRWAKQDLMSSEGERKRLHSACQSAQADLEIAKRSSRVAPLGPPPLPAPAAHAMSAPAPQAAPAAPAVQPLPAASPAVAPAAPPSAAPTGFSGPTTAGGSAFATSSSTPSSTMTQSKTAGSAAGPQSSNAGHTAVGAPAVESKQWRQDVLLCELACWEAAWTASACSSVKASSGESPSSWFALREAVSQLTRERATPAAFASPSPSGGSPALSKVTVATVEAAASIAARVRTAGEMRQWAVARGGARFVQVWLGLFPDALSELRARSACKLPRQQVAEVGSSASGMELFTGLIHVLHVVVLDEGSSGEAAACQQVDDAKERHLCTVQLLQVLLEMVGKMQPADLHMFSGIFEQPSLSALLAETPHSGSLHLSCTRLLQALVASAELFELAHQAHQDTNPLLAAANLLIIPAIEPDADKGPDSLELQQCRVAALELFCRCLATAPRLDDVLNLRRGSTIVNEEHVDTVLQRVVFLCHHELLCLGLHGSEGGPWHDPGMRECARTRQRAVELALMILSSFTWHAAPWILDGQNPDHSAACAAACTALGRMRPLLASIADMIVRRAQQSSMYARLLSSVSALRVLLAGIDGDCSGCNDAGGASMLAVVPMAVG